MNNLEGAQRNAASYVTNIGISFSVEKQNGRNIYTIKSPDFMNDVLDVLVRKALDKSKMASCDGVFTTASFSEVKEIIKKGVIKTPDNDCACMSVNDFHAVKLMAKKFNNSPQKNEALPRSCAVPQAQEEDLSLEQALKQSIVDENDRQKWCALIEEERLSFEESQLKLAQELSLVDVQPVSIEDDAEFIDAIALSLFQGEENKPQNEDLDFQLALRASIQIMQEEILPPPPANVGVDVKDEPSAPQPQPANQRNLPQPPSGANVQVIFASPQQQVEDEPSAPLPPYPNMSALPRLPSDANETVGVLPPPPGEAEEVPEQAEEQLPDLGGNQAGDMRRGSPPPPPGPMKKVAPKKSAAEIQGSKQPATSALKVPAERGGPDLSGIADQARLLNKVDTSKREQPKSLVNNLTDAFDKTHRADVDIKVPELLFKEDAWENEVPEEYIVPAAIDLDLDKKSAPVLAEAAPEVDEKALAELQASALELNKMLWTSALNHGKNLKDSSDDEEWSD